MSGASVVHTASDYDTDGMSMARGSAISGRTGTRRRPRRRSLRQRRAADGGRSEIFALPWALLATARTGRSGTGGHGGGVRSKREKRRKGESLLKLVRQLIESVNDTLKGQLDLEQHGGRTFEGVAVRVAQRVLALATAIWHNHKTGQPITRSLIAYDH